MVAFRRWMAHGLIARHTGTRKVIPNTEEGTREQGQASGRGGSGGGFGGGQGSGIRERGGGKGSDLRERGGGNGREVCERRCGTGRGWRSCGGRSGGAADGPRVGDGCREPASAGRR